MVYLRGSGLSSRPGAEECQLLRVGRTRCSSGTAAQTCHCTDEHIFGASLETFVFS